MEHIDKDTFKQIFRDHWDDFKALNPRYNTPYYDEVIQKMLDCGDPEKMGFAQYRCFNCGEERRIAFSCKSSFCLSCAKPHTEQWTDFISRRLLPGGQGLATYLAKYVVSPPICVKRIERYDGNTVSYWYRDHKSGQIEHTTLPSLRFIGRMVQHILPKGFQPIRYYGLHANVRYADMRENIAEILSTTSPKDPRGFRILPRKPFAQLFLDTFDKDPLLCPKCRQQMDLELIRHPKYGVIKDFTDELFMEIFDERPKRQHEFPGRTLDGRERMVQISMPFL